MEFTGERYIPEIEDTVMQMEHLQRYFSLCDVVKGLDVLDVACGEGYGSNFMAETAGSVVGVDISSEAVQHAKCRYVRSNLSFKQGSATDLSFFQDGSFDAVVSFETIEHIDEPSQQAFLAEIKRVLRPEGFLVMSTPDKKIYSDLHGYHNEFHIHEFYKDEFVGFLKSKFSNVTLFNQYFEVTGILERDHEDGSGVNSVMRFGNSRDVEGKYLVAIASDRDKSASDISSVYMNPLREYERLVDRVLELQVEVDERNKHIQYLDDHNKVLTNRIHQLEAEAEKHKLFSGKIFGKKK